MGRRARSRAFDDEEPVDIDGLVLRAATHPTLAGELRRRLAKTPTDGEQAVLDALAVLGPRQLLAPVDVERIYREHSSRQLGGRTPAYAVVRRLRSKGYFIKSAKQLRADGWQLPREESGYRFAGAHGW